MQDARPRESECCDALRRRDEFLAMLSHELRNPLAAIANAGQVLLRASIADPLVCRARDVINREASQMARLIDDLLDVCRVSCGKVTVRKEPLDLAVLALDAGRLADGLMRERGLTFECWAPRHSVWIQGDAARLHQMLANLLTNAAKYTDRGGCVRMTLSHEDHQAVVRVVDNGIGIGEEELPLIFDPFYQSHVTLARSEAGLGVGLSLVRGLAQLHDGDIVAESDGAGQGSTFTLRLPIVCPPLPHVIGPTAGSAIEAPTDLRVLVIEDNPNGREMLQALLELEGFEVDTAPDGSRGLEMLEFQPPDVALVDIGLPGLDGYQIARRVRQQPELADVFLVALTGYGQPEDARRALEAGFDVHIVKPLDPEQLLTTLTEHRSRSAARTHRLNGEGAARTRLDGREGRQHGVETAAAKAFEIERDVAKAQVL